jgi:hypothetical protein
VLAGPHPHTHPAGMFVITEAEAAAIRAAFEQSGELWAAVELRPHKKLSNDQVWKIETERVAPYRSYAALHACFLWHRPVPDPWR